MFVATCDPSAAYLPTSNFLPTKGVLILPSIFQHVIAARTNQGKLNVERPQIYFRIDQDQFSTSGNPCDFLTLSSLVWEFDTPQAITLNPANAADVGQNVTLDLGQSDDASITRSIIALANPPAAAGNTDKIYSISNPALQGNVSVNVAAMAIVTQMAGIQTAAKCQRLRLVSNPSAALTVRVLGKRITPSFSADTDSPGVDGMDGILMELAYHDMLLRDERGGTQEDKDCLAMAATLTKQLVAEEVQQAAYNSRIMPECGFGGDERYGGWPTKGNIYG